MDSSVVTRDKGSEHNWWLLALLLLAVCAVWGIGGFWASSYDDERGLVGDMFGGVNALFSGLAFATLIYTVRLQSIELRYQREELSDTRKELRGQRMQMVQQTFESTFAQLFRVFLDVAAATRIDRKGRFDEPSVSSFESYVHDFRTEFLSFLRKSPLGQDAPDSLPALRVAYESAITSQGRTLDRYHLTLYNLLKYIDKAEVTNKRAFTNIVRATLSHDEAMLLLYACLVGQASGDYRTLIERYALLKHLRREALLRPSHERMIAPCAFGESDPFPEERDQDAGASK